MNDGSCVDVRCDVQLDERLFLRTTRKANVCYRNCNLKSNFDLKYDETFEKAIVSRIRRYQRNLRGAKTDAVARAGNFMRNIFKKYAHKVSI